MDFMALVLLEILFMGPVTLQGVPQACVPTSTGVSSAPALCGSGAVQWRELYSGGSFVHTVGDRPEQTFCNQLRYHL